MGESKIALRTAALSLRSALSHKDLVFRSGLIQARVRQFPDYLTAPAVALYASIQNEVMTDEIREDALRCGKSVFYPKLGAGDSVEMVQIASADQLVPGHFGILEPAGDKIFSAERQEHLFVLVPGLAFDLKGNRLGRGRGWYDRLLKKLGKKATAAGLAFDFQIVDQVPREPWDEMVAYIFTEMRLIECRELPRKTLSFS